MRKEFFKPDTIYSVPVNDTQIRLDRYLSDYFENYSRSYFTHLIKEDCVKVNDAITTKPSTLVGPGDLITLHIPPKRSVETSAIEERASGVEIVESNPHFLILYKPASLLVHPPSNRSNEATLVDWLTHNYQEVENVGYADRPGIVHRLDKNTSGLIIIPRTNHAHSTFGTLFRERTIHKTYYAIVEGHPDPSGAIDAYIGRDPITKTKMVASKTKKTHTKMREAQTHYSVVEYFDDHALLEVKPVTGRTHQIRVHLALIGHPIIGDPLYGSTSKFIKRQALHAAKLAFDFGDQHYSFTRDLPEDMQQAIKKLRTVR